MTIRPAHPFSKRNGCDPRQFVKLISCWCARTIRQWTNRSPSEVVPLSQDLVSNTCQLMDWLQDMNIFSTFLAIPWHWSPTWRCRVELLHCWDGFHSQDGMGVCHFFLRSNSKINRSSILIPIPVFWLGSPPFAGEVGLVFSLHVLHLTIPPSHHSMPGALEEPRVVSHGAVGSLPLQCPCGDGRAPQKKVVKRRRSWDSWPWLDLIGLRMSSMVHRKGAADEDVQLVWVPVVSWQKNEQFLLGRSQTLTLLDFERGADLQGSHFP